MYCQIFQLAKVMEQSFHSQEGIWWNELAPSGTDAMETVFHPVSNMRNRTTMREEERIQSINSYNNQSLISTQSVVTNLAT